MIVRFSDKNDINGIVSLWNEAFGDSEDEIRFFLDNRFKPENTLIAEENGTVASMLFLLEGNMIIDKSRYSSYYLYAACTSKIFRGRGFMAALLSEADRVSLLRNKRFICLMPGEKSLFDFYENHGYLISFGKKLLTVNRTELDCSNEKLGFSDTASEKLRNNAFGAFDYFEWDKTSVEFAFKHNKMYSGLIVKSCKGYILYSECDDTAYVKEFAFAEEDFEYGLSALFSASDCEKAVISLPVPYKTGIGECEITPSAMLYPVSDQSKELSKNLKNAYLGLTLD